jgi:hypothetical protein
MVKACPICIVWETVAKPYRIIYIFGYNGVNNIFREEILVAMASCTHLNLFDKLAVV